MKFCIPIRAKSIPEAKKLIKKAEKHADFLELWLDLFIPRRREELIKFCQKPVIAVCRARKEKGSFQGSEKARIGLLSTAIIAGAKFLDVGIHTKKNLLAELKKLSRKYSTKLIVSKHFWSHTPSITVLWQTYKEAKRLGADIVKIATYARNWSDNVILFELTQRVAQSGGKIITLAMGEKGSISRIGCLLLGSYLTYVALDEKSSTAPGQITIKELCHSKSALSASRM